MTAVEQMLSQAKAANVARQEGYKARYADIVRATATGKEIDPESTVEFLSAAGIEFEQYQSDVEKLTTRLALAAKHAELSRHQRELEEAQTAAVALDNAFTAAVEKLRAETLDKIAPLRRTITVASKAVEEAQAAGAKVYETAPQELRERSKDCTRRLGTARQQLAQAQADLAEFPKLVAKAKALVAKREGNPPVTTFVIDYKDEQYLRGVEMWKKDVQQAKDQIPGEAMLTSINKRIADAAASVAELERESADLERQFMIV
ncbi:MAG: hypothetical protein K8U57_12630 [Planctomycetes bacterium]|nr:hypothetical protein [Planctomycetota bacterium]